MYRLRPASWLRDQTLCPFSTVCWFSGNCCERFHCKQTCQLEHGSCLCSILAPYTEAFDCHEYCQRVKNWHLCSHAANNYVLCMNAYSPKQNVYKIFMVHNIRIPGNTYTLYIITVKLYYAVHFIWLHNYIGLIWNSSLWTMTMMWHY